MYIFDSSHQIALEKLLFNCVTYHKKLPQDQLGNDIILKLNHQFTDLTITNFYDKGFNKSLFLKVVPRLSKRVEIYLLLDPITLHELNSTFFRLDASFHENSIFIIVLQNNLELSAQYDTFRQSPDFPGFVVNPIFVQQSINGKLHDISFPHTIVTGMIFYSYLFYSPYVSGCRIEILKNLRSECHRPSAILDILAHHLNVTVKPQFVNPFNKNNFDNFIGPSKLEVCIGCGYKFQNRFSRRTPMSIRQFYTDITQVYYCKDKLNFERVEWNMFIRPIRSSLWVMLLITYVTVCLINRNLYSGFTLFATILGQGFSIKKWLRNPSFYIFISPIIFVTFWYTSIMTTNIVAPIPSKVIQTFAELFGLGYRIISMNEVQRTQIIQSHGKKLTKPEITFLPKNFYVDSKLGPKLFRPPTCNTLEEIASLNVCGLVWGLDARRLVRIGVFEKYNSEGFACYLMPEPLHDIAHHFFFKTVRLKEIERIYENILASGVVTLYEHLDIQRSVYKRDFHKPNKCGKNYTFRAKKMTLGSPIVVGFYVLGFGTAFNLLIFFVENVFPVMTKFCLVRLSDGKG